MSVSFFLFSDDRSIRNSSVLKPTESWVHHPQVRWRGFAAIRTRPRCMGLKNATSTPRLPFETREISQQNAQRLLIVVSIHPATTYYGVVPPPAQCCRSAGCFRLNSNPSFCPPFEGTDAGFSTSPRPPSGFPDGERAIPLAPSAGEEVDGQPLQSASAEGLNTQ